MIYNNLKTKKKYLAKAIVLVSLFVVSSAQAAMTNKYTFCPDGTSFAEVTQYEYIYQPTTVWRHLGGGRHTPDVNLAVNLDIGSWYSMLPFMVRAAPFETENEYRYNMTVVSEPGFVNMSAFHDQAIQIKNIVPTGSYLENNEYNFYPECQVDVTYL